MSLHDRIMAMDPEESGVLPESHNGYAYAQIEAAQIAKEADELMTEMAAALSSYAELEEMEGEGANVAIRTLKKYNAWKESNQ